MTDETTEPTPAPEAAPADAAAQQTQDPAQLASDFKKDELQTAAAVQGVDVPASATKADLAEAIVSQSGSVQPVVVDLATKRDDNDPILGSWVDVVSGEYQGRYGSYVSTVTHDPSTGYPDRVMIKTRDKDDMYVELDYSDLRPSERNGGR